MAKFKSKKSGVTTRNDAKYPVAAMNEVVSAGRKAETGASGLPATVVTAGSKPKSVGAIGGMQEQPRSGAGPQQQSNFGAHGVCAQDVSSGSAPHSGMTKAGHGNRHDLRSGYAKGGKVNRHGNDTKSGTMQMNSETLGTESKVGRYAKGGITEKVSQGMEAVGKAFGTEKGKKIEAAEKEFATAAPAGGSSKRAMDIEAAEKKALGYAKGGVLRGVAMQRTGVAPSLPRPRR